MILHKLPDGYKFCKTATVISFGEAGGQTKAEPLSPL